MTQSSLKTVTLHETSTSSFLASEKGMALKALCEDSVFQPVHANASGPYDLILSIQDGRLVIAMTDGQGNALPTLVLSARPYSRLIRDYFMMIESCETLRRTGAPCQLESVDMARRGLHNEGADLLIERLSGKITLDHPTARRLFTLICALHGRDFPVF